MKKINKIKGLIIAAGIMAATTSNAQFIEDALRFSNPNGYPSARAAGLGISYMGVVDDYSALYYNPAGLNLIPKTEISAGMDFMVNTTDSKAFNSLTSFRSNKENLNNLGVAVSFPYGEKMDKRGSIAIGYYKESNYAQDIKTDWLNPLTSYISSLDPAIAYHIYLTGTDNAAAPKYDSLHQKSEIYQSGGINNFSGGAAFEINNNVSLGFSIAGKWGSYDYTREITETDDLNRYQTTNQTNQTVDIYQVKGKEILSQSISGISGSVGLLGKVGKNIRMSVGVKFPTYYEIDEKSQLTVSAIYDNGDKPNPYTSPEMSISYKVKTPFVYSGGLSFYAKGLVFSAGIEYKDASQLEYSDVSEGDDEESAAAAKNYRDYLNHQIKSEIVGQVTWGFGAEYELPMLPLSVRASYTSTTSPYSMDVSGANRKTFALGAGYSIDSGIRLDFVMLFGDYTEYRTNYGSDISSRYTVNIKPVNIGLNCTMRF